ncbi:hypothetical protein NOVOSPHI9U_580002 [Novosphingobium sp. 9U]|nr:hypothetical protein NOVOSPHI9U_580002 [Novosphingobium sp. 9U]
MTWTWYQVAGDELIAVAGIWRQTDDWGDSYSMVITADGCGRQMPVILAQKDWEQWTRGKAAAALQLCKARTTPLLIERSTEVALEPSALGGEALASSQTVNVIARLGG